MNYQLSARSSGDNSYFCICGSVLVHNCGILAQLVEHMTFNHGVPGSSPGCLIFLLVIILIKYADVAELADALDLGSSERSWGFESLHPQ